MGMCIPSIAPFGVLRFVASQSPPIAPFSTVSNSYEENQSINSHLVVYIHTIFQLNRHRRTSPIIILARKIGGNPNCNDGLSREFTSWSSVFVVIRFLLIDRSLSPILLIAYSFVQDPRSIRSKGQDVLDDLSVFHHSITMLCTSCSPPFIHLLTIIIQPDPTPHYSYTSPPPCLLLISFT